MSIPFSKYINITSGIGAGANVPGRSFIARVFTANPLVPTGEALQFFSLEDVGNYFGTGSEEYMRASFYFAFISKNVTRPQSISYASAILTATNALIFGSKLTATLSQINLITTGVIGLSVGGVALNVGPLNFSTDASLAAVATRLQTAIRLSADPHYATATVTYDAVKGAFNFVSGSTGNAAISVSAGTGGVSIQTTIGWGVGAILSNGQAVQTITDILDASVASSDNFGSFCFTTAFNLTVDQAVEAGQWNAAQNVKYMFMPTPKTNLTDALAWFTALELINGTCLNYNTISGQFPEMLPMAIFASTDFTRANSVQNYMFYQAALDPSVSDNETSNTLDSYKTNYYGNTQEAGNNINFYQRGVLTGVPTSPSDINVYANEIWLKDAAGVAIMRLLLSVGRVPANNAGRGQILAILQSVIDQALFNGTISTEKPLTPQQIVYITELTNDPNAYRQVGSSGYWINVTISPYVNTNSGLTEYEAIYLLVYSKDDAIRFVQGTHVLI